MEITAEGVETKAQLDLIRAEGCTEAQGFYFSVPRLASELVDLMGCRSTSEKVIARPRRSVR